MHTRGVVSTRGGLRAVLLALVVAACAEAQVTPAPTPRPTPVITPDPHLTDPTTADAVFLALAAADLRVTANNAGSGKGELVKRINATYFGWPLVISQYRSTPALAATTAWTSNEQPARGEPPVRIAGLNILVEWGPITGPRPKMPTGAQREGLRDLAETLDVLLSPIRARSVVPVPGAVPVAESTSDESEGEASPAP